MAQVSVKVYNAVALSGTATVKGIVTKSGANESVHYAIVITGTPTGTLSLEVNDVPVQDYDINVAAAGTEAANTTNWIQQDLSPTATIAIAGAPVNHTISFVPRAVRYRLTYTNAASTGTLNAWVTTK